MGEVVSNWRDDEFKWLVIVALLSIAMMVYLYRRYKLNKNEQLGKAIEIIDLGNFWKWIMIVFFLILAIITQIYNS